MKYIVMKSNKGFTLIELSIVIVIIGLIVSGVVGGQAIVKQATIRAEIAQFKEYQIAFNTFNLEYDGIPGDLIRANEYWPTSVSGDGDGLIEKQPNGALPDSINLGRNSYTNEVTRTFEHLSLARLINHNYDNSNTINVGFPSSKTNKNIGILMGSEYAPSYSSAVIACFLQQKGSGVLAMAFPNTGALPNLGAADNGRNLSPKDMQSVDTKMDDGNGATGKFISMNGHGTASGRCHNNGEYSLNQDSGCRSCYYFR